MYSSDSFGVLSLSCPYASLILTIISPMAYKCDTFRGLQDQIPLLGGVRGGFLSEMQNLESQIIPIRLIVMELWPGRFEQMNF
ncbi:MAG: hypothetical protein ACI9GZ_003638 [Bacteroidia bacterium]|jgi:hypothetical protein